MHELRLRMGNKLGASLCIVPQLLEEGIEPKRKGKEKGRLDDTNHPTNAARMARQQSLPRDPVQQDNDKGAEALYRSVHRRRYGSCIHPIQPRDKPIRGTGGIGLGQGGRLTWQKYISTTMGYGGQLKKR